MANDARAALSPEAKSLLTPDDAPANVAFPVAYEGKDVTRVNLVLEGGSTRALFTAGVTDVFLERGLLCEHVIGVSAGALVGYNYVAGLTGRSAYLNLKYCTDWRYLSLKSFARTGNAFGREMSFELIPDHLDPFPYEAYDRSPMTLTAVSSDLETGEAYYPTVADARADAPYLMATSAQPLISQIVERDGRLLLDGGTCDSVPIIYSKLTGARKHIVVCTQHESYRKHPNKLMPILRQRYAAYPYYVERLQMRHYEYNRTCRALRRMHDAGEIFLIAPQKPVEVASMEQDQRKLLDLYEQGVREACRSWDALQAYLAD